MKIILILIIVLFLGSCSHKDDVQCFCYGNNNQSGVYDLGIKNKPSLHEILPICDSIAAHNGLDSCQIYSLGK